MIKRLLLPFLACLALFGVASPAVVHVPLRTFTITVPATSGHTCGTAVDANDGDTGSWTNPANAQGASNASYATTGLNSSSNCDNLQCTAFTFTSADIPGGSTINNISVSVRNKTSAGTGSTLTSIQLVKGGVISGTSLGSGSALTTSDRDDVYTGLGGLAWTQSDVTSSGFGVAFKYGQAGLTARTISVDSVTITITYTASASHRLPILGVGARLVPGFFWS